MIYFCWIAIYIGLQNIIVFRQVQESIDELILLLSWLILMFRAPILFRAKQVLNIIAFVDDFSRMI